MARQKYTQKFVPPKFSGYAVNYLTQHDHPSSCIFDLTHLLLLFSKLGCA